jgi:hypothetical protein
MKNIRAPEGDKLIMYAQLLAIIIANTSVMQGGQGYCAFEFTLSDQVSTWTSVDITLRPNFDPNDTATGLTSLEDIRLHVNRIGKKRVKVRGETDCNVTSFYLTYAGANEHGDLISDGQISIGRGKVPISIFVE